jgi:mannose-6-phosphate isomerase-like protein (cupin superfamily)
MTNCDEFIASGILELFVCGVTTEDENAEVRKMLSLYPEVISREISEISTVYEKLAEANHIEPDPIIKPFLLARIDYTDRLMAGEPMSYPPKLSAQSKISDFDDWLQREDMILPDNADGVYAKILGFSPDMITAVVWIKEMAPQEVHDDQFERFLILEGTCNIVVGEDSYALKSGDFFEIPLHHDHVVNVTSAIRCKAILQRVAA